MNSIISSNKFNHVDKLSAQVYNSIPQGIILLDLQYSIVFMNDIYKSVFSKCLETYIGDEFLNKYEHSEIKNNFKKKVKNLVGSDNKSVKFNFKFNCSTNKNKITISANIKLNIVEENNIGYIISFNDIRTVTQTERLVFNKELNIMDVFDNVSNISIQAYNLDREILYWSQSSEKIFGYTQEEVLGKKVEDILLPFDQSLDVVKYFDYLFECGRDASARENTLLHKNGSFVHVYSTPMLFDDENGNKILYCIDVNYSDLIHAKKEISKRELFLVAQNKIKSKLLEDVDDYEVYQAVVEIVGKTYNADRSYFFVNKIDEEGCHSTQMINEFVKPGVERISNSLKVSGFDLKIDLPYIYKLLESGSSINMMVNDMPQNEQVFFSNFGIKSILLFPIISKDNFVGFVGIDDFEHSKLWKDEDLYFMESVANDAAQRVVSRRYLDKIAENEMQYRALIENNSDLIMVIDASGKILYLSPSHNKVMGYNYHELKNKSIYDKIFSEQKKYFEKLISRVTAEKEKTLGFSFKIMNKSGKDIFIEGNAKNLLHVKSIDGIVINYRDISLRVQSEKLSKRYHNMFSSASSGALLIDEDNNIVYINKYYSALLGYKPVDLLGENISRFFSKKYFKKFKEFIDSTLEEGFFKPTEIIHLNKEGRFIHMLMSGALLIEKDNDVKKVSITALDNSESINTRNILLDYNNRYRLMNKQIPFVIWNSNVSKDLEFTSSYVSETINDYLALPKGSFGQNPANILNYILPEYHQVLKNMLFDSINNSGEIYSVEYEIKRANNEAGWFMATVRSTIVDGVIKIYGVILDVSEQKQNANKIETLNKSIVKQLEDYEKLNISLQNSVEEVKNINTELEVAKNVAEEKEKLKTSFLHNVSHEIRTPMNGILGFLDLLQSDDVDVDDQSMYLDVIRQSSQRLMKTITNLLDISRIDSNQLKMHITDVNGIKILSDIHSFFDLEAKQKGIQLINNSIKGYRHNIHTDYDKLFAILSNLVKNAIKYTNSGYIEFGGFIKSNLIEFYIKDTGIGISEEQKSSVFDRFVQLDTDNTKTSEGSGLGLSIVQGFLDKMGGKIWFNSEPNVGSTFKFNLPYSTLLKEDTIIQKERVNVISDKINVLIVDDEEVVEIYYSVVLKEIANRISVARNGAEALDIVANEDFDLILMDIRMPFMGGYDALKEIRKINKNVVIVAQTAFVSPEEREKAAEAGFDDFIAKPVLKSTILKIKERFWPMS